MLSSAFIVVIIYAHTADVIFEYDIRMTTRVVFIKIFEYSNIMHCFSGENKTVSHLTSLGVDGAL